MAAVCRWVVKENKHGVRLGVVDIEGDREFHDKNLVTQATAQALAEKFNKRTAALGPSIARIQFLTSYLIETHVPRRRLLFAERRLEERFQKWNTNNGVVVSHQGRAGRGVIGRDWEEDDDTCGTVKNAHVPQSFLHSSTIVRKLTPPAATHRARRSWI